MKTTVKTAIYPGTASLILGWLSLLAPILPNVSLASNLEDLTGWEQIDVTDGITSYSKKVEGSALVAFRGRGVISAPIYRTVAVLEHTERKVDWADRALEFKVVQNEDASKGLKKIEHARFSAFPAFNRDFVFELQFERLKETKQVIARLNSVTEPKVEEVSGHVRAEIRDTVYVFTASPDGQKTQIDVQVFLDPKGILPAFLVNLIQSSWARKTIQGIQREVARENAFVNLELKEFFFGDSEKQEPPRRAIATEK